MSFFESVNFWLAKGFVSVVSFVLVLITVVVASFLFLFWAEGPSRWDRFKRKKNQ